MKNLILFSLVLLLPSAVFSADIAATPTSIPATNATSAETATNQTLLSNGAASRKILEDSTQNTAPTSIKILGDKGSSTTSSKSDLTDQDKQLSENYVDQGGANRIIQEKCKGDMAQVCAGTQVDHKVMGMDSSMIKAAAQAYASFGAMGDILPLSKPDKTADAKQDGSGQADSKSDSKTDSKSDSKTDSKSDSKSDSKKDKATDYCKYIPTATEALAAFNQKTAITNLNNGGETSQKEALLKAAKSHDERAAQAQIQTMGWYGGAACYAGGAAMGAFAVNTSLIVKMGAATLLGVFYQGEIAANKEYAKKTRDIANSLPGKGDCNPVTQNECYCAEVENENDPTYCKDQIAKKKAAASAFTRVACTDSKLQVDPTCSCEKTNNCFDKLLENQGSAEFQLGFGTTNSPFKSIASLAHGKLENGTLNSQAFSATSAIAKKALNDLSSKVPGNNNPLTLAQKQIADSIASKGIPANIARLMAQNSPPQNAVDKAMAKLNGLGSYNEAAYTSGSSNVLDFSGGGGLGVGGRKNIKKEGEDFLGKLNPKGGALANAKLLEFAQKAQSQAAQITKSDRPLFEIISLRYQMTGRRLLQIDPK